MKNVYEILEKMKQRPVMYLGDSNISTLRSFLDGYYSALYEHGIIYKETPDFHDFSDWAARYYNYYEGTKGWANIILENSLDEKDALANFFKLLYTFKQDKLIRLFTGKPTYQSDKHTLQVNGKIYKRIKKISIFGYQEVKLFYVVCSWEDKQTSRHMYGTIDKCFKYGESTLGINKKQWKKL